MKELSSVIQVQWAADDFRSVNGQIEWLISQKLKEVDRFKTGTAEGISKSAGKGKK
ncbi:MAG: hypothetical protein ABL872_18470 [Lacibacter sp.]